MGLSAQPSSAPIEGFQWLSPLGIAVMLFILYGLVYILIGALTPIMQNTPMSRADAIFWSHGADTQLYGKPPTDVLASDPSVDKLRTTLLNVVGGLLVAAGLFQLAITWFGLREGQTWALAALVAGGLVVILFWYLAFRPYIEAGVARSFIEVPPFMLVPALLLIPAIILGWIGLR